MGEDREREALVQQARVKNKKGYKPGKGFNMFICFWVTGQLHITVECSLIVSWKFFGKQEQCHTLECFFFYFFPNVLSNLRRLWSKY